MAASPQGPSVCWEKVSYVIQVKDSACSSRKRDKVILQDISGCVLPGQMLAIMGATGAGKSSLLDVLAQRKNTGRRSGTVLINGRAPDRTFRRLSGYVTQDDCLLDTETVYETFRFYADMRLPPSISRAEKQERLNKLLFDLGLEKVRNSRIGSQFQRGISGGELKRTSIGCELITDPGLLFLDEPTTGLDASNSLSVMEALNRLSRTGKTIICTIHQPRSNIYELFDQLLLLSKGQTVYFGPAADAVTYFAGLDFRCGEFINPADFFLDVAVENERAGAALLEGPEAEAVEADPKAKSAVEAVDLIEAYRNSALAVRQSQLVREYSQPSAAVKPNAALKEYATNWFQQCWYLGLRVFRRSVRSPSLIYAKLGQAIVITFLLASMYWQTPNTQNGAQDRIGVLFFVTVDQGFGMFVFLTLFLTERTLFNRERSAGVYRTSAYFVSKSLVELPFLLFFPIVFGTLIYWTVGLYPAAWNWGVFELTLILTATAASSMFLAIGALSPNTPVAQILAPIITVVFLIFAGFYVNLDSIPVYYSWIKWISLFNYALSTLCYNEFIDITNITCSDTQKVGGRCPIPDGQAELELLGMSNVVIWEYLVALVIMIVVYRFLAFIFLLFLHREKR